VFIVSQLVTSLECMWSGALFPNLLHHTSWTTLLFGVGLLSSSSYHLSWTAVSCAALPPTCYTIEVGRQCCTVHCLPTCCTIKVGHQCYLAHCPPTCYISLIGWQCCLVHRPPTYHVIKVGRHSCYALSPNLIITSSSWATLLLWLRYDTIRYEMLF